MNKDNILEYADKILLNENLESYEATFGDSRDGYFKRYVFENGDECVVYYPETITSNTKVSTYYPGSGFKADWYSQLHGSGNVGIQDYLMESGSDQIVIMPHSSTNTSRDYIGAKMTTIMTDTYQLNSTSASWSGFSLGATPSIESAVTYMELNPDCDPQVVIQIDGYSSYQGSPSYTAKAIADDFKNTGSIIVALDAKGKGNYLDYYAKEGINVIKVISNTDGVVDVNYGDGVQQVNRGSQHVPINQDFYTDGFLEFNAANGSALPTEGYTYYAWDSESNSWYEIDVSEIDTYEKLNEFFGNELNLSTGLNLRVLKELSSLSDITIESDDKALEIHLNNIRGTIRNTNFLQGDFSSTSYASTTNIPSQIPTIINSYFQTTSSLLSKIANETTQFAKIAASIEELDFHLSQTTEEITQETLTETTQSTELPSSTTETTVGAGAIVGAVAGAATSAIITTSPSTGTTSSTSATVNSSAQTNQSTNSTQTNNTSQNTNNNTNTNKQQSTNASTNTSEVSQQEPSFLEEFPKYEELYSDDTKIVYNYNDEYKIVIHKEGDNIIGIEHYYDFETTEQATSAIETLTSEYASTENFDKIVQNDRYVKVLFKEESYKNLTLNQIKEKYSNLKEVLKGGTE